MADPPNTVEYASYYNNQNAITQAKNEADAEYNKSKLAGESEDRALARAKFAWEQVKDRAGLTGRFEDNWTMPVQQWFTSQFGTWMPNGPAAGQQTMERENQIAGYTGQFQGSQTQQAQQQAFNQAQALAAMYGSYYQPGQTPTAGMQTQAAQQQAYNQWLAAAQEARANQTAQQQAAQSYLTLLSNLRGPADWAKYQQVLGAGGNMNTLAAAAMGQYIPGGGATSGYQPQAANLNTMYNQVAAAGQQPGMYAGGGGAWNENTGQYDVAQQNLAALRGGTGISPQTSPQQQVNAYGNGTNAFGAQQPGQPPANQMNLPAPN